MGQREARIKTASRRWPGDEPAWPGRRSDRAVPADGGGGDRVRLPLLRVSAVTSGFPPRRRGTPVFRWGTCSVQKVSGARRTWRRLQADGRHPYQGGSPGQQGAALCRGQPGITQAPFQPATPQPGTGGRRRPPGQETGQEASQQGRRQAQVAFGQDEVRQPELPCRQGTGPQQAHGIGPGQREQHIAQAQPFRILYRSCTSSMASNV